LNKISAPDISDYDDNPRRRGSNVYGVNFPNLKLNHTIDQAVNKNTILEESDCDEEEDDENLPKLNRKKVGVMAGNKKTKLN